MQGNIQTQIPRLNMRELPSTFVVGIITMMMAGIWAHENGHIERLANYVASLNFLGLHPLAWSTVLIILAFPLGFLVSRT